MAYTNFKQSIWSKHIQKNLPKFAVFEKDCNYQYSGDVGQGKTVKILGVARPTIGTYTGGDIGAPQVVSDTLVTLNIDQAKFFNFMVDDVDKAQAVEGLMESLIDEAVRAISEQRDSYIAEVCAKEADAAMQSASTAITSKATAKTAIDTAIEKLWQNGVTQKDDVTIYLNPRVYMLFQEYMTETKTDNNAELASGVLGNYAGCKIKMSTSFHVVGTDDCLVVKTSKAVAFCGGLDNVEAYRPEGLFSDAVKGLNTYGCKVVRPKELYIIKAH